MKTKGKLIEKNYFSLIEILFVLSIIVILSGLVLASVFRSKKTAKYIRWKAYNSNWSKDTDNIINFNFEEKDYVAQVNAEPVFALRNMAGACDYEHFQSSLFDGILKGNYSWTTGRWFNKKAVQFNGIDTFVSVKAHKILNFNPEKDNFSISMWLCFDNMARGQTFFSKADMATSQYHLWFNTKQFISVAGGERTYWHNSELASNKWFNIVFINKEGISKLYYNGKELEIEKGGKSGSKQLEKQNLIFAAFGDGSEVHFDGRIDEILVFGKALSASEIEGIYKMGKQ